MRVHLRKRKQTSNGRISLFLEIYKGSTKNIDGKAKPIRDYEYLNLYLRDKPKDNVERQQNKETLQLANGIKAKRELDIQNGQYGFTTKSKSTADFIAYFEHLAQKRVESKGNYGNWDSALKHLINFSGHRITFQEIDEQYCSRFLEHLTKKAVKKKETPKEDFLADFNDTDMSAEGGIEGTDDTYSPDINDIMADSPDYQDPATDMPEMSDSLDYEMDDSPDVSPDVEMDTMQKGGTLEETEDFIQKVGGMLREMKQ